MKIINKPNFIIFTGGPGAGKTAVLDLLREEGYHVVSEVARAVIKEQQAIGGNAMHTGDRKTYCDLMLQRSLADYRSRIEETEPIFFDRGIPDLYSYSKRFCGGLTLPIQEAVKHYRYHVKAVLFPAWPEIYCHDTERKHDFSEAIATYHAVKEGYTACGYQLIELPKCSIVDRVAFILKIIEEKS